MTTYGAYDENLPCRNPNCKSHGKPHPNCKCYGGMAKGGMVEHFCASDKKHEKSCPYYAEGGEVDTSPVEDIDPETAVAAYFGHMGLHGLLQMEKKDSEDVLKHYQHALKKGHKHIKSRIDGLLEDKKHDARDLSKEEEFLHKWIEKGGITHDMQEEQYKQNIPTLFAEGGKVEKDKEEGKLHNHHIATAYPSHNALLQTAKSRVSHYLNGLKPQKHTPRLAFDDEPDKTEQEKTYKRALKIAAHPLGIMEKIHSGKLEKEHVQHFRNLYPEMDNVLQKKITEKILEAQLEGKKPSYKTRQSLSLFLGTPLSGELSPQNIQAAQATFQGKGPQQPQQPPVKNKRGTSSLTKVDDSFLTSEQSRIARSQKQ